MENKESPSMDKVFTIGHSRHPAEDFIRLLQQHRVTVLLDVRSAPYSVRYPQFNREALQHLLIRSGIAYRFAGEYFGARQENPEYYTEEGWLDYRAFARSDSFRQGVDLLDQFLCQGDSPVLMCAEKDPFDCHRAIMVGRELALQGYEVIHILEDGKLQSQAELDGRLLDKYFPKRDQGSIFDLIEGETDPADLLREAYHKRNEAIAWQPERKEE